MTKAELLAYKNIKAELRDIEKRIEDLRSDARNTKGVRYSDMPRGRGEPLSAQQRYIEKLEELSELYEEKKTELKKTQIAIERAITVLPPELRMLMRYRYIDGMKWEQVNELMRISHMKSVRLHKEALHCLQNI